MVAPEGVLKEIAAKRPIDMPRKALPIAIKAIFSGLRAKRPAVAAGIMRRAGIKRAPTALRAIATVNAKIIINVALTKPTETPAV